MFTVRVVSAPDERDALIADLHEAGTLGILEEEQHLVAWFDTEEVAARFGTVEVAPAQDWSTAWQQVWTPRLVGERFYLSPPWMEQPTPPGRIRIDYQPGMACGTGEHPGTRLAMMGLEAITRAGDTVLMPDPVLTGRSEEKLRACAEKAGLPLLQYIRALPVIG